MEERERGVGGVGEEGGSSGRGETSRGMRGRGQKVDIKYARTDA